MADSALTGASTRARPRLHFALRVAIVYAAARAVTALFFFAAAELSGPASRFGAAATVGDLSVGWDGQWYWLVALNGYPADLPLSSSGQVAENAWAFMPIYAYLALAVGAVVGSWVAGAVWISLIAGYLSCLVLYRMLRTRLDAAASMWAVVFFAAGPLAGLFHLAYAESLFLLELFSALWLVMQRRYGWLFAIVPLMAFTRPGVLAFALFMGLYGLWRFARRGADPLRAGEVIHIAGVAVLAAVLGVAWQVIAAWVTGVPDAYLATELAWRRNWVSDAGSGFVPFDGFLQATGYWSTLWQWGPITGYVVLAAAVVGIGALLLFEPHVKRLGVEVRLWTASYLLYLLAVFFPQSSTFRLLLPVSPLWGAIAAPRSLPWRVGVLLVGSVGQWWWIYNMYSLGNMLWQIP